MLLSKYKQATLLCPTAVTGGPEALHQVSDGLNRLGFDAGLGYFELGQEINERQGDTLIFNPPAANPCLAAYAKYNPVVRKSVELTPDHLIIVPEVRHYDTERYAPAGVAIWWLSVDNAMLHNKKMNDPEWRREYFSTFQGHHLHQSVYAREFLRFNKVGQSYLLADYTSDVYTGLPARAAPPGRRIAFYPPKGGSLARAFFEKHRDLTPVAIRGMAPTQVAELFRENLVFIDFGHFPGKDRMPREAAVSGGLVFTHRRGSARFYDDFPLPEFYKFDAADIESGSLYERVTAVLTEPERRWSDQELFRTEIRWEKSGLRDQLLKLLGARRDI